MGKVLVIGSVNVDIVTFTDKRPKVGETLLGNSYKLLPGGKGANQAIAASRIENNVDMICATGNDRFRKLVLDNFTKNNIRQNFIETIENANTGMANIIVSESDNSIIVVTGANYKLSKEMIEKHTNLILESEIVLLQLEIELEVVEYIVDLCYKNNIKVILNPAPARKISSSTIEKVTYITPNETEFEYLFTGSEEELLNEYPNKLIITKGQDGVIFHNGYEVKSIPTIKVNPVDTTGAGDTFNGILAALIANNYILEDAIELASIGASISVESVGAQGGMPSLEEIVRRKNEENRNFK